jgi:hypothetical protein
MVESGRKFIDFLEKEVSLVDGSKISSHNNSSDILESIFGKYKYRKSPGKLNGVTPYILCLPLYTRLCSESKRKKFDFKTALEDTRMHRIDARSKDNLSPNLMKLPAECLKKIA